MVAATVAWAARWVVAKMVEVVMEGERVVAMAVEKKVEVVTDMDLVAVKRVAQTGEKVKKGVHIELAHPHTIVGSCRLNAQLA